MQLKQQGKQVRVTLSKPELRRIATLIESVLEPIGLLPCDQAELAKTTAAGLESLVKSMTRTETQPTLPFGDADEKTSEAE